jgi:hypothetical protein
MRDMRAVWLVWMAHLGFHTLLKHFVTALSEHFLTALRSSIAALLALLLETKLSLDAQRRVVRLVSAVLESNDKGG